MQDTPLTNGGTGHDQLPHEVREDLEFTWGDRLGVLAVGLFFVLPIAGGLLVLGKLREVVTRG